MWKYPDEVKKFISENVTGRTAKELAELSNSKFGTSFTESSMKSYKHNHDLKSGTRCGLPPGHSKIYPPEIREFISYHYIGTGHKEMANMLNQAFGTAYTKDQMKSYYSRFKLNSGLTGRFDKGHIPANKGKKGAGGWEPTQFKKGNIPPNRVPVGTERVDSKDGYIYVKIQDGQLNKNWKQKHVLIWEKYNGPVPEGHALIFGDGNKLNFDPENLILVTRAQLAVLNKHKLIQNNVELTKTAIAIADLKMKISQRRKKHTCQNGE